MIANANTITNETYYKSLDAFYALRSSALSGDTTRILATPTDIGRMANPLMPGHDVAGLGPDDRLAAPISGRSMAKSAPPSASVRTP